MNMEIPTGSVWHRAFGEKKYRVLQNPPRNGKVTYWGEITSPKFLRPKYTNFGTNKKYALEYMQNIMNNEASSALRAWDARQMQKTAAHNIKPGSIFSTSWGYDQTNVNYYQVLKVKGKSAYVRAIYASRVSNGGFAQDNRVRPALNQFKDMDVFMPQGNPLTRKLIQISSYDKKPMISIDKNHHAKLWEGEDNYETPEGFGH